MTTDSDPHRKTARAKLEVLLTECRRDDRFRARADALVWALEVTSDKPTQTPGIKHRGVLGAWRHACERALERPSIALDRKRLVEVNRRISALSWALQATRPEPATSAA